MRIILASMDELGNVPFCFMNSFWNIGINSYFCVNINLWHHLSLAFFVFSVGKFFFFLSLFSYSISSSVSFFLFFFNCLLLLLGFFLLFVLWSIKLGYWLKVFFFFFSRRSFFKNSFYNLNVVDFQCFRGTAEWFSYTYRDLFYYACCDNIRNMYFVFVPNSLACSS